MQPHLLHQTLDALMVDRTPESSPLSRHPWPAVKGRFGVWDID
jgi:hypothetical protein